MNNNRRLRIKQLLGILHDAVTEAEEIKDEEQGAFDNMPESFQYADKGQAMEEGIGKLETGLEAIQEAIAAYTDIEGI